ncbi:hypothetical protein [Candidatus Vagococcus giribetii]|nr:hypothetical protein [Vagococcus sp. DIV0080]
MVLIVGSLGQLGRELCHLFDETSTSYVVLLQSFRKTQSVLNIQF